MQPKSEFDEYSENYEEALAKGISVSGESKDFFASHRVKWLHQRLNRHGGTTRRILDFGCGTGSSTPYLCSTLNPEILVGCDPSEASLEVARREFSKNFPAHFITNSGIAQHGPYNLAFCNGVFHHIPLAERPECIRQIHANLQPGGIFAFWENNPLNPGTRYVMSKIPFDRDAITLMPWEAKNLLRQGNFEILETTFQFIFPRSLSFMRVTEPAMCRLPLGAQYLVLARRSG